MKHLKNWIYKILNLTPTAVYKMLWSKYKDLLSLYRVSEAECHRLLSELIISEKYIARLEAQIQDNKDNK